VGVAIDKPRQERVVSVACDSYDGRNLETIESLGLALLHNTSPRLETLFPSKIRAFAMTKPFVRVGETCAKPGLEEAKIAAPSAIQSILSTD
jgi:hypothetical protein